jgi:DNA-binding transcriptional MerR regulator
MGELIKIREMSLKYDISARTLKYYESMGLIESVRSDDYAYRLYDENAVVRLKQILILRKLNVSIKDIQKIFNTFGSEVVLEVLAKKVESIDEEAALLFELKEIVLEFIQQIKQADFGKNADVIMLYEKAKEIEAQITNEEKTEKTINENRLLEISKKLDKKIPDILIVNIPKFKAVAQKYQVYDDVFTEGCLLYWMRERSHLMKNVLFDCADFFCRRSDDMWRFVFGVHDSISEIDITPYEHIEFAGGLYATSVSIDDNIDSIRDVESKILKWLEGTSFIYDDERDVMENMPFEDCDEIQEGLGYAQLQRYIPIKLKKP